MGNATISERVITMLCQDDGDESLIYLGKEPLLTGGDSLTEFELNLRRWGFVYGLCYGLARAEGDPFEPRSSIGERALEAAQLVWEWDGDYVGQRGSYSEDREWRPVPEEAVA